MSGTLRVVAILMGLVAVSLCGCSDDGAGGPCGNGVIDVDLGEECDGEALGGMSCMDFGLTGGTLGCDDACQYELTQCEATELCGDGVMERLYGEECDATDLDGETCESMGYLGGTLACSELCLFDTSDCEDNPLCGNGVVDASVGEECDGDDFDGETCSTLGHYGGDLACTSSCVFDRSGCGGFCGNFVIDGGEACDNMSLGGETCETLGWYGGALDCLEDCTDFDESLCEGRCGDNVLDSGEGETCDDGNNDDGDGCSADCQLE